MIDPQLIDIETLPSVALSDRKKLPEISGIYLAVDSQETVQYIGKSVNLNQRWKTHHRHSQFKDIGKIKIVWIEVSEKSLLLEIETALIEYFNPVLNQSLVPKKNLPANIKWVLTEVMNDREIDNQTLHQLTGLHLGTISKLKQNLPSRIDMNTLNLLCHALKCQPGDLIQFTNSDSDDEAQSVA